MVVAGFTGLSLVFQVGHAAPEVALLQTQWEAYLRTSVRARGRVVDHKGGGITTSEGQAYALMRAVWIGDAEAFSRVYRWTLRHLQDGDASRLPAWKYGRTGLFCSGVLDRQPASDADLWMVWALLMAAESFQQPDYRTAALRLADRIWKEEVARIGERTVLLPGPWAASTRPVRVNPSYFLPFVFRTLAQVDPSHDWNTLLNDGYAILAEAGGEQQLLSDWLYLDPSTGAVVASPEPSHALHGFEALRLAWTFAAEVAWVQDARARAMLTPYLRWRDRYAEHGWLPAVASADGAPAVDYGHPALVGALLPAWAAEDQDAAMRLYETEIAPSAGQDGWGDANDYYAQNWIWFGLALWNGLAVPPEMTP